MTHLIIVRHAESDLNCQNRIQGHMDSCLTAKGLRQARRLAKRLRDFHIDKVYSSDLGRAYTTTREITKHLKAPIVKDPLLREINLGIWEGKTPAEVDKEYNLGYQKWLKRPSGIIIPKGERIGRFRKRITSRVEAIAKANHGKTVLIVTHGGAITALLADWLKAEFDALLLRLEIENTSLTFVTFTETRMRLLQINDTDHLSRKEKRDFTVFRKN